MWQPMLVPWSSTLRNDDILLQRTGANPVWSRGRKVTTALERLLQETDLLQLKYGTLIGGYNAVF